MIDYNNTNLRPKTFFVKMVRERNGSYTVKRAKVLEQTNQYARGIRQIDARDFTRSLKNNDITVA